MNALMTNSTAMQSNVLGVQNISVLNKEQKQQKAEIAQASLMAESNNKKSKGADQRDNNVSDQNSKVSAGRAQELREKSLDDKQGQSAANVSGKGKSEEARALVRFESMMQKQEQMETNQEAKSADKVAYNEATEEQKFDDDAAMEIVAKQQKAFDARYAYGALADSASVKNMNVIAKNQENYDNKTSTKSMTGELKVEKFVAPVPITEIRAPIMPSDHIYVITQATERAAEDLMNKKKEAELVTPSNQQTNNSTSHLSLDKRSEAQLESAPEGTKSPHNADAPDLSYGLAS